jgi:Uma2 family endonuclease
MEENVRQEACQFRLIMAFRRVRAGARGTEPTRLGTGPEICVEILSPSNSVEEMVEKCALYFEAGAKEVWLCGMDGEITFYAPEHSVHSGICRDFPRQI